MRKGIDRIITCNISRKYLLFSVFLYHMIDKHYKYNDIERNNTSFILKEIFRSNSMESRTKTTCPIMLLFGRHFTDSEFEYKMLFYRNW